MAFPSRHPHQQPQQGALSPCLLDQVSGRDQGQALWRGQGRKDMGTQREKLPLDLALGDAGSPWTELCGEDSGSAAGHTAAQGAAVVAQECRGGWARIGEGLGQGLWRAGGAQQTTHQMEHPVK